MASGWRWRLSMMTWVSFMVYGVLVVAAKSLLSLSCLMPLSLELPIISTCGLFVKVLGVDLAVILAVFWAVVIVL